MNTSIFVIGADNHLNEFRRTEYGSEDVFQKILADHPAMLRGAAGSKGKLILVQREKAVPDQIDGAERWSLDHLFLDADGVPVLVEVKQASDTRARREVVAQMHVHRRPNPWRRRRSRSARKNGSKVSQINSVRKP